MNKCLKITFDTDFPAGFLQSFIQKNAKKLELEGAVQVLAAEKRVRIIVCGNKENVDTFLDTLHNGTAKYQPENIEIEPFLKKKDYRGVFRVIE